MPISNSLCTMLCRCRNFSSLSKIPSKYRPKAIQEAQKTLTEYFHATRSLPFIYAEHISKNSLISLSNLIAEVDFSTTDFSRSLRKFLSYNPINEFEFFYESIGIDYNQVRGFLPKNKFFISEDMSILEAASALAAFGFPWIKLGKLYKEDSSIFSRDSNELTSMLSAFKGYGFSNTSVIGICLAFPFVLSGELGGEIDALFNDLKRVFLDFDLKSSVEGNVDGWHDICMKIRVFYDLGFEKRKLGDIIGESKAIFVEYPAELLLHKIEYFSRFGVTKVDAALFLLQRPEIFGFDLETPLISVKGLLKHFGFNAEELEDVARKYPYVMGRNRMENLPHVMKAMDLHSWFFNKIKDGDHKLLADYAMEDPDEDFDTKFNDELEKIRVSRTMRHSMSKVDFVHRIGFGENASTAKILVHLHGNGNELMERFSCLLRLGVTFSNLCFMLSTKPKILNHNPDILEQKVKFLRGEMQSSLQELNTFPGFLCFNLENRVRPRYRFHMWLTEKGLSRRKYSIGSIVATSEKNFVARIYGIHPAAVKHWLECFANRTSDE
ncbi:transcription termination factor MTEF18, mitochondrial [Euphorbia lathyris]|uniref:transcription termination factor MTEF18, mitochondrial n=1 Tax=Euphorbia lathyris TaxID=212925 RepID=UPI00331350F3